MGAVLRLPGYPYSCEKPSFKLSLWLKVGVFALVVFGASPARAGDGPSRLVPPVRSDGWSQATNILALSSLGLQVLMPRVFYSDPEVTVGWKGRWHVSVLAPTMTLLVLGVANEAYLKDELASFRPGCDETTIFDPACVEYGLFSTQSFLAFSSLGHGTGVFLVDTLKWSDGNFNVGGFMGNVGVPLVLSVITALGRTAGDWESAGQVWASAGVGVGAGLGMGVLYALAQRPECGYSGGLICW